MGQILVKILVAPLVAFLLVVTLLVAAVLVQDDFVIRAMLLGILVINFVEACNKLDKPLKIAYHGYMIMITMAKLRKEFEAMSTEFEAMSTERYKCGSSSYLKGYDPDEEIEEYTENGVLKCRFKNR